MHWATISKEELRSELKSSLSEGLTEAEAQYRLQLYGPNSIETEKEKTASEIFLRQFLSPVIYLLIVATIISFFLNDRAEGIAILVVIFLNAFIGFYMEWTAVTSMKALKKMDIVATRVIRDGILKEISSDAVTQGDLIYIEAGDLIPADARLVEVNQLQVDESTLTGESLPVIKSTDYVKTNTDERNLIFKGTSAVKGNGKALVTNTGRKTEFGKISDLVVHAEQAATPLEKKLQKLSGKLIWLTVIVAAGFFITGWIKGYQWLEMFQTSIAMAVAAIPEGLPIVATIALAYGMKKMAKKNVIVKHLAAVETLGSANIILTDKTGTLTENKITIIDVQTSAGENSSTISINNSAIDQLLLGAVLCNDATIHEQKENGDPLEIALLKWAKQNNKNISELRKQYFRIHEDAFTAENRMMATYHKHKDSIYVYVKGAAEEILKRCNRHVRKDSVNEMDDREKLDWLKRAETLAENGIRVLAFGYAEKQNKNEKSDNLIFTGLVGFSDPPDHNIASAIAQCKEAGIKIVMVTGDHPATALHIAKQLGLAAHRSEVIQGTELQGDAPGEELKKKFLNATVFARVTPKQKLDIVQFYQQQGYIAAMTGDGVNDAPALKKADIGIAMGIRGTQIAKETADLVLKDDSFISIVSAVKEGRIIFENIRKSIMFLLSCNLSEILVITVSALLAIASPLSPLQILYLNLVTDVFPALAIAVTRGDRNIMKQPPRDPQQNILVLSNWSAIIIYAMVITLSIFTANIYCRDYLHLNKMECNNIVFISLALAQLWHVFNLPAASVRFFRNEITKSKYVWLSLIICIAIMLATYFLVPVRNVLSVSDISSTELIVIIIASLVPVAFIQLLKRLRMVE
jgi:P-type Ca2+ transporter type 2C